MRVDVVWRVRRPPTALPLLHRVARHALRTVGFRAGSLSVAVVGARAMATLHQHHLGIVGPTDVLTFDLGSDRTQHLVDAEIIICAEVARRQAARRGGTSRQFHAELALYLVHGILHLAGFDDHNSHAATRMHAREDALLRAMGLGSVYTDG